MALTGPDVAAVAHALVGVPGVLGVMLGGSRARGEQAEDSDLDLGLYYRASSGGIDTHALGVLARELGGGDASVTEHGAWGPWVDGGGWLQIDGTEVDWIYRDLDRVQRCWTDAEHGRYSFHAQVGHPLGVPDFAYPGEVALGQVLADPTGILTTLTERYATYPPELRDAVVRGLWEARFLLGVARKGARRGDAAYVTGCLVRVVLLCAHALHAADGRWLVNEKGAVASAGGLPHAPARFDERTRSIVLGGATRPDERLAVVLEDAVADASALVTDVEAACREAREDQRARG